MEKEEIREEVERMLKVRRKQQILWLVIGVVVGILIWEFILPLFLPEAFYDWFYGIDTYTLENLPLDFEIDFVG